MASSPSAPHHGLQPLITTPLSTAIWRYRLGLPYDGTTASPCGSPVLPGGYRGATLSWGYSMTRLPYDGSTL